MIDSPQSRDSAHFAVTVVTPTAKEPLSLDKIKEHLRVDFPNDDREITAMGVAAREMVEIWTRRTLVTTTLELTLDHFTGARGITTLPFPNLQVINSINYIDSQGDAAVLALADVVVDTKSKPGRVQPTRGKVWPTTDIVLNAVTINYDAGYGDETTVPEAIKAAILLLTADLYEHRESQSEIRLEDNKAAVNMLNVHAVVEVT